MKTRERILAYAAGSVFVMFLGAMAVWNFVVVPSRDLQAKADEVRAKIRTAEDEKNKGPTYQKRYREIAAETLGLDEMKVSEELRNRITEVLAHTGLSATNLSLKPLTGSRVPGVYKEIGWLVRARGKLPEIVKFLFLMDSEPALHRLDNMSLTPVPNTGDVEIQVKFATLVLEPGADKIEVDKITPVPPEAVLAQLAMYDVIKNRDLIRPYRRRQPVTQPITDPTAVVERTGTGGITQPVVPPGRYKIVGLPMFLGVPDIEVSDTATSKVARYKQGDELAGGRIITVDYRPLPRPNNPALLSTSRVVIQVGSEYHAIELGDWTTNKHKLAPDQVPPELPPLVAPPPAPKAEAKAEPKIEATADPKSDAKAGPKSDSKSAPKADAKGQRA